jgi:lactate dehydrogenase-like 2-hydroxyacid dehydrogenase
MSFNVYVTRLIPRPGIELLERECETVEINPHDRPVTRQELLEAVRGRDGILCLLTDRIDEEVFKAAEGVKGFANYAVGYDNVDVAKATEYGIPVSNTPGVLTDATAEMAWALLFAVARRVVESDRFNRSGNWAGWGPMQFLGGDLTGATLGVVGAGRIGTAFALKSRGFDMTVLYADQTPNEVLEGKLGARRTGLEELLRESDYVSIHVPLAEDTFHLISSAQLDLMKPTAYLINTSRGPVVDEAALVDALRTGKIAGAGLDVYENEPRLADGLAELDNVVLSPHTASATVSTRGKMALMAATNLLAMMTGEPIPNLVNPEVMGR